MRACSALARMGGWSSNILVIEECAAGLLCHRLVWARHREILLMGARGIFDQLSMLERDLDIVMLGAERTT
jgi:hypothetical protein